MPHSKNPSKTLTKKVFLIRRISPVSNSPLPLNTPLPCFHPRACLITFCRLGQIGALEGLRGGKAMGGEGGGRVDVAGREEQDAFFGGACWGLVTLADATENVRIEVSRISTIAIPSQVDHSKHPPPPPPPCCHLSTSPSVLFFSLSLSIPVCTQKPWGKVLTLSTLRRT